MEHKVAHLLYMPLTGLGLYGGHRGRRWLRNRIKIFKQFVVPSLLNQSSRDFYLWVSFRYEDRGDSDIMALCNYLEMNMPFKCIFTFTGVCFWDDKYSDEVAHDRLVSSIHEAVPEILNVIGEASQILMTIQPSDDCYYGGMVAQVQEAFRNDPNLQAVGYKCGYVMDYKTRQLGEWNPTTNPPFYTIRFLREIFVDPMKHVAYAGIKSHEYLVALNLQHFEERGFLVGTHGENISTVFNHPFTAPLPLSADTGEPQDYNILSTFGLQSVPVLRIKTSWRKTFMRKLPHGWQRKSRYWFGERFAARIYDFLRA